MIFILKPNKEIKVEISLKQNKSKYLKSIRNTQNLFFSKTIKKNLKN